jgi:ribosomal protein S18 acetylase RimI-like enzyme
MFTLPEVRRQGIAKALMEKVVEFGSQEASRTGREFAGSIVVDADNPAAKALYERSGYVVLREEPVSLGSSRTVLLMKYSLGRLVLRLSTEEKMMR